MLQWPHSPSRIVNEKGTYIVTGSTYDRVKYFKDDVDLDYLQNTLLTISQNYKWNLEAWAIFPNHYHFIAQSSDQPENLADFISNFHVLTARYINSKDKSPNRQVWFQYWDTRITFQRSYLARLNYVKQNAVKHGIVKNAIDYPWCSAKWFEKNAPSSFLKSVLSFKTDNINIIDDF